MYMADNNKSDGFYVNNSTVFIKKSHVPYPMGSLKLRYEIDQHKNRLADELTAWIQLGKENERAINDSERD